MDRFLRLVAAGERALVRLAVAVLALVVVGQALVADRSGRWLLTFAEPGEGWPGPLPVTARPAELAVTLALEGGPAAPRVAVLVNGRPVASFSGATVTVRVRPGDRLAVDARCCRQPLAVRVVAASPGVSWPAAGSRFPVSGRVTPLGGVAVLPGR